MKRFNNPDEAAGAPVQFVADASGKVIELIIERSRWARVVSNKIGDDLTYNAPCGLSLLLNANGGMCCLGFYSRACGLTHTKIYRKCSPSFGEKLPAQMSWLIRWFALSGDANELMRINDLSSSAVLGEFSSSEKQEEGIQKVFAKHGIKISFV